MSISKFAAVAAVAIALCACGTHPSTSPQLTVNGHAVSIALYNSLVAAERQKIERTGAPISSASSTGKRRETSIEASVIRELIRDTVVEQLAATRGITISAADLETRLSAAQQALGGPLAFEQALAQAGLSPNDFRTVLRYRLLEAQLSRTGATASTRSINEAVLTARVTVTIGPCAERAYPSCVTS
jgi:parvulin-like peptidyl-prolyl isomerase